ncbi:unnamed protein product [Amaranthus hypochondriacus]
MSMTTTHHHHHNQVSGVPVFDLNYPKSSSSTSGNHVIELLDDDFDTNLGDDDDDYDCVFVKKEKNLTLKGSNKKDPILIDDYSIQDTKLKGISCSLSKINPIVIDDSAKIQCVDDYDDDICIISVRPSSSFLSSKKKMKPFRGVSITEVGESSGSTFNSYVEIVDEIENVGCEEMFLCEICADSKPQKESFRIKGCLHSYCSSCIESYVASKLLDGVSRIDCPVPSCCGVLEPEYCRGIIPFDVFVRWGNLLCESVILSSQKFYCPFKDCSALLVDDGSEMITMSECPNCHRLFCAQCKVGWHDGVECAEYQSLSKDEREKDDIMLRKLAKSNKWQRCPVCKFYVEKSEGCLYMKCRCGIAFCYRCGDINTDHAYHYCKKCGL